MKRLLVCVSILVIVIGTLSFAISAAASAGPPMSMMEPAGSSAPAQNTLYAGLYRAFSQSVQRCRRR